MTLITKVKKYLFKRQNSFFIMLVLSPYFITKRQIYLQAVEALTYVSANEIILDVGCGSMPYKDLFQSKGEYIGLDYSITRNANIVGSASCIPIRSNSISNILCFEVLEHTNNPYKVISEFSRVLHEDGIVILTTPMCWSLHYEPYDYFRFTNHGLRHLFYSNNFEVLKIERVGGLFTFFFARLIDIISRWLRNVVLFRNFKYRGFFVSILMSPIVATLYLLALILDKVSSDDAMGWSVVAKKKSG